VAGVLSSAVAGADDPIPAFALVYVATVVLAEMLHHAAAVAIMFPIAVAAAANVGADPRPFVMAVAVAGCCAFASPVTYQTHLIVYGPGGYRFGDFVRAGLPLDVLCGVIGVLLIPVIWHF
jgi:di/tricarboxylate transporter